MMNIPCALENSRLYIYRVSVTMVFDLNTFEGLNIDTCSLILLIASLTTMVQIKKQNIKVLDFADRTVDGYNRSTLTAKHC